MRYLRVYNYCYRKYGPLKEDYQIQTEESSRRTISDVGGALPQIGGQLQRGRPDVLPGLGDVPDASGERLPGTTTIRRKDSVARMTWDGLAYVVTVTYAHGLRINSNALGIQWPLLLPRIYCLFFVPLIVPINPTPNT